MITTATVITTLKMFAFLATELTVLFLAISYLVGILQHYIPQEKIENLLSSKNGKGYVLAAFLGAITPFCSCSTIPFLKGLLRARAGFGTLMVFLIASPLLNPIIIGLLIATFSLKVALFYFLIAMITAILAGIVLEKLGFEKYIRPEVYEQPVASSCSLKGKGSASSAVTEAAPVSLWLEIWRTTWKDFKAVLPYLLLGIAIGSLIYGFIPTEFIASVAGKDNPWAIPVAAIIGVPLYIRAEAVIPLSAALAAKGMSLGAVLSLIIGSAGASLTEVILLKSIFKNPIIIAFLVIIFTMAISAGFLYQPLFG